MKEKNGSKVTYYSLILIAIIILISSTILIFTLLSMENMQIASADNYESTYSNAEIKAIDFLKKEYNLSELEAKMLVKKVRSMPQTDTQLIKNSNIDEDFIIDLVLAMIYALGRHSGFYDHVYIDNCSHDNYYYVDGSNNSLKASNYNDQNIICRASDNKEFMPSNRNAISSKNPEFNVWLKNDHDTLLMNGKMNISLEAKDTSKMTNDSWDKGVYYRGTKNIIPNSNKAIGKGAAFYRFHYYDGLGEEITSVSNWTVLTNIFANGNIFDLCTISVPCDIEIVIVYETYDGSSYHDLREDFYIKARKDSNPGHITFQEANGIKSDRIMNGTLTTPNSFRILPKPFAKYSVSYNGNKSVPMSFNDCLETTFNKPGTYIISFLDVIYDSRYPADVQNYTVLIDDKAPTVKLDSIDLHDYDLYTDDTACFKDGNYNINWVENKLVSTTVTLDGNIIENNTVVSSGEHTITITKKYSTQNKSKTFKIKIGTFTPNHNYNLLTDGASYTNRPNRFSTKYYGIRLLENGVTNSYGYDTQKEALDKALEYERVNYVTQNSDNSFTYRGTTYSNNASLTAAMNVYAQMYLFENRDLTLTENVNLEASLKQERLYLNGFQFTYNSNPVFSSSVRIYKAPNLSDVLTANVKSILRDASNPNVKNVEYNKLMDEQLTESGKYFVMDKNAFGEEYFFEAYFATANETTAAIEYYDASGIRQTAILSKSNTAMITGTAINIKTISNGVDPFATIKVRNIATNASRVLVVGDNYTITEAGSYSLTFIDRNNKQFSVLLSVTDPAYILSGVSNGGSANNDVTISMKNGYVIQSFIVNGVSKGNVFQYDPTTGRYEYTITQTAAAQEVVLIFTYGGQSVNIAFTVTAK